MRARLAAIPALLLVAIAIWEIVATRRHAHAVPGDDEWAKAAAIVRRGYQPGDLIVFVPAWVDPVGRLHLGDLIPIEMAARMDAARYGRIWELAIRGEVAPDVVGLVPVEEHLGAVEVRRYERAPAVVLADLTTAKSSTGARADLVEVAFEPHRCLVIAVPSGDDGVRIVFPELPLGGELVGYFGAADIFTRREHREPVTLVAEAPGSTITAVAHADEWVRFRLPTYPSPSPVAITLTWTAAKPGAPPKSICLAGEVRR